MADQKLTALTEEVSPSGDDLLYIVTDVAGTPTSQKVKWSTLPSGGGGATILQLAAAYSDENVTDLAADTVNPVWSKYNAVAFTLTDWLFDVVTAPTGSAITLDVHLNGTTIFSTKPTIAASANTSSGAVLSTTAIPAGGLIEVFVDAVGSTTAGKGLKGDPIGTLD